MTLRQFKHLSEDDQQLVLQNKAVHIASIEDSRESLELFQLDSFYIEIECVHTHMRIITVNFFDEPELLEPYLDSINIDEVLQLIENKNYE
jgi:hypothetical protein